jgi:hypothetical protein
MLKLYCCSKHVPDENMEVKRPVLQECNAYFYPAMYMLWLLRQNGVNSTIIDTFKMDDAERKAIYESLIPLAISKKYKIRTVFGTKHETGIRFGIQVPALLVFKQRIRAPVNVYPHRENGGNTVTINHYLLSLLLEGRYTNVQDRIRLEGYLRRGRSNRFVRAELVG